MFRACPVAQTIRASGAWRAKRTRDADTVQGMTTETRIAWLAVVAAALEKEFAALHEAQQEQSERLRRQAAFWKLLAWGIALVFLAGAVWMLFLMFRQRPRWRNR